MNLLQQGSAVGGGIRRFDKRNAGHGNTPLAIGSDEGVQYFG
jgi:hypothetical protein